MRFAELFQLVKTFKQFKSVKDTCRIRDLSNLKSEFLLRLDAK
jgi:hypothetical protein